MLPGFCDDGKRKTGLSRVEAGCDRSWGDALASVLAAGGGGGDVLEAAVPHLAPAAAAADEVEEGLDLEQGEDLAVAEVLPDRVPAQAGEVLPGGIPAE